MSRKPLSPSNPITVVELFAGVGGFRLGLEGWKGKSASSCYRNKLNFEQDFKVLWSNQWEPSSARSGERQEANMVYHNNWGAIEGSEHYPHDLGKVCSTEMTDAKVKKSIPEHDLLVGGFPCQDYSVAGVNSKGIVGKKGVLWWNIHKLLKARRPKHVFLENVDRLLKSPTTDRGRDFAIMLTTLNSLGYAVEWKVINAADYGMPQRRRRVYILAHHKTKSNIQITSLEKFTLEEGVFAKAFPSNIKGEGKSIKKLGTPQEITKAFGEGKFLNSGSMKNGKVWMCDFKAKEEVNFKSYSKKYHVLGDVLTAKSGDEITEMNGELASFIVDKNKELKAPLIRVQRVGFEINPELPRGDEENTVVLRTEFEKWRYLKGKKAEERQSSKGVFYYTEGPLSLTDKLEKPSRTIITSEGGPGASRFKHLIEQDGIYRRLLPIELERLNMFHDEHTKLGYDPLQDKEVEITASKRAFFMGNALVVGVIERVGKELAKRIG